MDLGINWKKVHEHSPFGRFQFRTARKHCRCILWLSLACIIFISISVEMTDWLKKHTLIKVGKLLANHMSGKWPYWINWKYNNYRLLYPPDVESAELMKTNVYPLRMNPMFFPNFYSQTTDLQGISAFNLICWNVINHVISFQHVCLPSV